MTDSFVCSFCFYFHFFFFFLWGLWWQLCRKLSDDLSTHKTEEMLVKKAEPVSHAILLASESDLACFYAAL
jgi:hypothetical protein